MTDFRLCMCVLAVQSSPVGCWTGKVVNQNGGRLKFIYFFHSGGHLAAFLWNTIPRAWSGQ